MKITAETVTDDEIRALRASYTMPNGERNRDVEYACSAALAIYETPGDPDRMSARAACADMLNARAATSGGPS
jgi:hypothetical protein